MKIIQLFLLFSLSIVSCSKDELPRSNPLDVTENNTNGTNGFPFISDGSVEQIYANGAVFMGEVYKEGTSTVYERGVCYNYSGNPSTSFYSLTNGTGIGKYQCEFSNLVPGYTYYYRAYAKNNVGISYGYVYSFTTPNQ
jgi:hypothetical protein